MSTLKKLNDFNLLLHFNININDNLPNKLFIMLILTILYCIIIVKLVWVIHISFHKKRSKYNKRYSHLILFIRW